VPAVLTSCQNGLLDIITAPDDIITAPDYASSSQVYFTYVEPGEGGHLTLSRAMLSISENTAALTNRAVIWGQTPTGGGGQLGGIIALDPQGSHLFLTMGDRMQPNSNAIRRPKKFSFAINPRISSASK